MKTRKTISLPAALVKRISQEAEREERSFNAVVVRNLRDLFFGRKLSDSSRKTK
jgi:hypothetical protein